MNFEDLNKLIQSLPPVYHLLASVVILAYLSVLILNYITYIKLCYRLGTFKEISLFFLDVTAPCFSRRTNLLFSFFVMSFIFFGKFASPSYTMLDVFLPVYVCYYALAKATIDNLKSEVKELLIEQQVCTIKTAKNESIKNSCI